MRKTPLRPLRLDRPLRPDPLKGWRREGASEDLMFFKGSLHVSSYAEGGGWCLAASLWGTSLESGPCRPSDAQIAQVLEDFGVTSRGLNYDEDGDDEGAVRVLLIVPSAQREGGV